MGICTICGESAGFLRSKHPDCESRSAAAVPLVAVVQERPAGHLGQSIYNSLSEKIGPCELEAGRIEAVVDDVQRLKREGKLEEALQVLLPQLDLWEGDAAAGAGGVAPWCYEQAAIVYRKLKRFDEEIALLERFAAQQHAPGASPPQLLKRLAMAKWYALKRSGVDAPRPAVEDDFDRDTPAAAVPVSYPKPPQVKLATDQQPICDFIALDVETANADFASICAIGLAQFKSGELFKALSILVDPEDDFDPINISIHGITPEAVAGKPNMARVFPVIAAALSDVLVVHHSSFDKTALNRAAVKHGAGFLPCVWLDTLHVARRAWPAFAEDGRGYGLARLADAFSIEFQHHDAAEDARAAGLLMLRAMNDSGLDLVQWIRRVEEPIDGSGTGKHARDGSGSGPLLGEVIVFTGKLEISREAAAQIASAAGCEVSDTINRRTTILVVGDQDLRATKGQEKSSKHRKADALIAKGCAIRIVGESDFGRLVNVDG